MEPFYSPLPQYSLNTDVTYHWPRQELPESVTLDSPALFVMTDLRRVPAVTIEPEAPLRSVLKKMSCEDVHLLLVTDADQRVLGLITSTEVMGEKPVRFLGQGGGTYDDILVRHIMTPRERLEVLLMEDVLKAKVGHIVATLKRAARRHALVIDVDPNTKNETIRGIISSSQIRRQLGTESDAAPLLRSSAEPDTLNA
ncbi:MAG: CBS domain-containing protein [Acidiferrobacterales bacterium]